MTTQSSLGQNLSQATIQTFGASRLVAGDLSYHHTFIRISHLADSQQTLLIPVTRPPFPYYPPPHPPSSPSTSSSPMHLFSARKSPPFSRSPCSLFLPLALLIPSSNPLMKSPQPRQSPSHPSPIAHIPLLHSSPFSQELATYHSASY